MVCLHDASFGRHQVLGRPAWVGPTHALPLLQDRLPPPKLMASIADEHGLLKARCEIAELGAEHPPAEQQQQHTSLTGEHCCMTDLSSWRWVHTAACMRGPSGWVVRSRLWAPRSSQPRSMSSVWQDFVRHAHKEARGHEATMVPRGRSMRSPAAHDYNLLACSSARTLHQTSSITSCSAHIGMTEVSRL